MRFVIAPDSFKGCLPAISVAKIMQAAILAEMPDAITELTPMSDGGEGFIDGILAAVNGEVFTSIVTAPLGNQVMAKYALINDGATAVIEMAEASGFSLVDAAKRNPYITTSFGTGQLIKIALEHSVNRIILGLGGSATNDAGVGMLQALGAKFYDNFGKELDYGGINLAKLNKIDMTNLDPRLAKVKIQVACDVNNLLLGKNGASQVFAIQKGATLAMALELDNALANYANIVKKQFALDIAEIIGGGAAGGTAASVVAFLNGHLQNGIKLMIEITRLEDRIKTADFIFTGEGMIDAQTLYGKTIFGIATLAKQYAIPAIAVAGRIVGETDKLYLHGITSLFSINRDLTNLELALQLAPGNLFQTVLNIVKVIKTCTVK